MLKDETPNIITNDQEMCQTCSSSHTIQYKQMCGRRSDGACSSSKMATMSKMDAVNAHMWMLISCHNMSLCMDVMTN